MHDPSNIGAKRAEVYVRHVYGRPLMYPANEIAKIFADLAGVKSLSAREVGLMMRLGYGVFEVKDPAASHMLNVIGSAA